MITIYSRKEDFDTLESIWNELYTKSDKVTPYQSHSFCRSALPLLSGELHITVWTRKGITLAIFPLYLDKHRTLRFINDRHSDFCGPIIAKEAIGDFHMCEEISNHIKESKLIKRVRLENMRYDLFQTSLQFQLKGSLLYSYSRYSYFNVPKAGTDKSAIDSLCQLDKKEKYRLKNIASKMEKAQAEWRSFDADKHDVWPEDLIKTLTDSMIKAGIRKKRYFSAKYLSFIKGVYQSGALLISATYLNGQPASTNLYLKNKTEYIDWMAFYTEPSNNTWNLLQFLTWLHNNTGGTLNFARGIYMYKLHNFRPALASLDRLHYSKSIIGKIGDTAGCLVCEIKRMMRSR